MVRTSEVSKNVWLWRTTPASAKSQSESSPRLTDQEPMSSSWSLTLTMSAWSQCICALQRSVVRRTPHCCTTLTCRNMEHRTRLSSPLGLSKGFQRGSAVWVSVSSSCMIWLITGRTTIRLSLRLNLSSLRPTKAEPRSPSSTVSEHSQSKAWTNSSSNSSNKNFL